MTEVQRRKEVTQMMATLDDLEMPADLRAGLRAYIEQGSRLARSTSQRTAPS